MAYAYAYQRVVLQEHVKHAILLCRRTRDGFAGGELSGPEWVTVAAAQGGQRRSVLTDEVHHTVTLRDHPSRTGEARHPEKFAIRGAKNLDSLATLLCRTAIIFSVRLLGGDP